MRDIKASIRRNGGDIATFGLSFLRRHLGRLRSDRIGTVSLSGFGNIAMRCGESDAEVVRQVFGTRQYDTSWPGELGKRLRNRYEAILSDGGAPIIVDAGANIGAASVWFNRIYPEARIVAVEPDPENAAMLRKNIGSLANVVALEAAIGAEAGFVSISQADYSWAVTTSRSDSGVRTVTMAEAFVASGGDTPFLVKIDIEGFERDLFASNLDWLAETFAVIIEPHDWLFPGQRTSGAFQQALARHPFEMFIRGENLFYVRS